TASAYAWTRLFIRRSPCEKGHTILAFYMGSAGEEVPMNAPIKTVRDRYSGERIAAFYAGGYWQSASFNAVVTEQAARRGDQTFVFDSTTSLTYADIRDK